MTICIRLHDPHLKRRIYTPGTSPPTIVPGALPSRRRWSRCVSRWGNMKAIKGIRSKMPRRSKARRGTEARRRGQLIAASGRMSGIRVLPALSITEHGDNGSAFGRIYFHLILCYTIAIFPAPRRSRNALGKNLPDPFRCVFRDKKCGHPSPMAGAVSLPPAWHSAGSRHSHEHA